MQKGEIDGFVQTPYLVFSTHIKYMYVRVLLSIYSKEALIIEQCRPKFLVSVVVLTGFWWQVDLDRNQ